MPLPNTTKQTTFALLATCLLIPQCVGRTRPIPKYVREVTIEDIDEVIESGQYVVVMFYSPTCQHCKAMEPEYYVASQMLKNAEPPMKLVRCDATLPDNQSLLSRFNVMGYPSVKMFKDYSTATWEDYSGPRHSGGIIKYLKKWPKESCPQLLSTSALNDTVHQGPVSVIGYFGSNEKVREQNRKLQDNFEEIAGKMKYLVEFGTVVDESIVKSLLTGANRKEKWSKVKAPGVVVFQRNSQGSIGDFFPLENSQLSENVTYFQEWIKNNTVPKVVTLDMRNPVTRDQLDVVFKSKITQVIGFDVVVQSADDDNEDSDEDESEDEYEYYYDEEDDSEDQEEISAYVANQIKSHKLADQMKKELERQAVNSFKGNYQFIFGDMNSNQDTIKFFGLTEDKLPAYVIYDVQKDQKFLKEKAEVEGLEEFVRDFEAGKLKRHIKSEPIVEDVKGRVPKMVVALNFEELVLKNEQDVLLELFAPWCRNCKRFAPIYQQVAEHFKNETDKDVFVAVMNVDANDIPDDRFAAIEKIPTVLFIRKEDKAVCKFTQDMIDVTPDQVIEFVDERGGSECVLMNNSKDQQSTQDPKKEEL